MNDLGEAYGVVTETYFSKSIGLKAGHMIFTDPKHTPLRMPAGEYAVLDFIGDIVYEGTLQPVPLSTVYDHHWVATSSSHVNAFCGGTLGFVFGIGAESRLSGVSFPDGMGYLVPNGTRWGANIHLLRTEGLAGDDQKRAAKECNECYYGPDKGEACVPAKNGTFACCAEFDTEGVSRCEVSDEGNALPERRYQLRYTFSYTYDVEKLIALQLGTFSAPDCAVFYEVYRNDQVPVHLASYEFKMPFDATLAFAQGHMHTGALNVSLSVNGKLACTSNPTYGQSEGVAGDEKGYLVQVSPCIRAASGPLPLKAGDSVLVEGRYWVGSTDERIGFADGTHLNVMAYMYTAYYRTGDGYSSRGWATSRPRAAHVSAGSASPGLATTDGRMPVLPALHKARAATTPKATATAA